MGTTTTVTREYDADGNLTRETTTTYTMPDYPAYQPAGVFVGDPPWQYVPPMTGTSSESRIAAQTSVNSLLTLKRERGGQSLGLN